MPSLKTMSLPLPNPSQNPPPPATPPSPLSSNSPPPSADPKSQTSRRQMTPARIAAPNPPLPHVIRVLDQSHHPLVRHPNPLGLARRARGVDHIRQVPRPRSAPLPRPRLLLPDPPPLLIHTNHHHLA